MSEREVRILITGFDAFLLDVPSLWRGRRWEFTIALEHIVEVKSPGFDPKDTPLGLRSRDRPARRTQRAKSNRGFDGYLVCVRRSRRPTINLKLTDEPYEMVSLSVRDAQAKARAIKDAVRQIRPASLAMVDDLNRLLQEKGKELVREGKISEARFEETMQYARAAGVVSLRQEGELNDEEYARLKQELVREGNISEVRFEEIVQAARAAELVERHERGELSDEEYARRKRELAEGT